MGSTNPFSEVDCTDAREQVADYACMFVGKAHYLWGSCGDAPGNNLNGSPYRPDATLLAKTNTTELRKVSVFAGWCSVTAAGPYTCAGSYQNMPGGREIKTPTDFKELQDYLNGLSGKDESQWGPNKDGLFPREVLAGNKQKYIAWGEDCRYRRHFDCIGFVNFIYIMKVANFGVGQYSIAQWALGNPVGGAGGVVAKPPDRNPNTAWGVDESLLKPADVLCQRKLVPAVDNVPVKDASGNEVKDEKGKVQTTPVRRKDPDTKEDLWEPFCHHIGMYAGGGMVVQANDTPKGVTMNKYDAAQWHYAVRMPCARLIIKPGVDIC